MILTKINQVALQCAEKNKLLFPVLRKVFKFKILLRNLQTLYDSGNEEYNANLILITFFWDMCHLLFPDQLFLTSRRPFLLTFTKYRIYATKHA